MQPWFTKAIPFPFNFYYPNKFKKQAEATINALYNECDAQTIEERVSK